MSVQTFDAGFISVFVSVDWEDGTREMLTRTTDVLLRRAAESYLKDALKSTEFGEKLSEALKDVAAETAGAIASLIGLGIIKALWKRQDEVSRQLNRLTQAPFIAGVRMANEAINLPYNDEAERGFQEKRFDAAINELDRAWGLLENPSKPSNDSYVIAFLQGHCAYHTRGGRPLALRRFRECHPMLVAAQEHLRKQRDENCQKFLETTRAPEPANAISGFIWGLVEQVASGHDWGWGEAYAVAQKRLQVCLVQLTTMHALIADLEMGRAG